MIQVLE